ncbi:hypothetical protein QUA04_19095 [Microcoleus sp. S13_C5]
MKSLLHKYELLYRNAKRATNVSTTIPTRDGLKVLLLRLKISQQAIAVSAIVVGGLKEGSSSFLLVTKLVYKTTLYLSNGQQSVKSVKLFGDTNSNLSTRTNNLTLDNSTTLDITIKF